MVEVVLGIRDHLVESHNDKKYIFDKELNVDSNFLFNDAYN